MSRRFVYFQGKSVSPGAAVLYSVVAGNVREFWVKSPDADVKVHEIPLTLPYTPMTNIGGVGASATFSGVVNERRGSNLLKNLTAVMPPGGSFRLTGTFDFTWTGPTTPPGGSGNSAWSNAGVDQDGQTITPGRVGWSSLFGLNASSSGTWGNDAEETMPRSFAVGGTVAGLRCVQGYWPWSYIGTDDTYSPSATWTFSVTIGEYNGPLFIQNEYQSWISSDGQNIFVTIRDSKETPNCEFSQSDALSPLSEIAPTTLDFTRFNSIALWDSPNTLSLYEYDAPISVRAQNWRNMQESYNQPPDATGNSCYDAVSANRQTNFDSANRYIINLFQMVNFVTGQTLQSWLQSNPDTVSATMFTQSATNTGSSCELGPATTSTVQVPSPGRGNVEGIIYIP